MAEQNNTWLGVLFIVIVIAIIVGVYYSSSTQTVDDAAEPSQQAEDTATEPDTDTVNIEVDLTE